MARDRSMQPSFAYFQPTPPLESGRVTVVSRLYNDTSFKVESSVSTLVELPELLDRDGGGLSAIISLEADALVSLYAERISALMLLCRTSSSQDLQSPREVDLVSVTVENRDALRRIARGIRENGKDVMCCPFSKEDLSDKEAGYIDGYVLDAILF